MREMTWIAAPDAFLRLRVPYRKGMDWVLSGRIEGQRRGKHWVVSVASVEALEKELNKSSEDRA